MWNVFLFLQWQSFYEVSLEELVGVYREADLRDGLQVSCFPIVIIVLSDASHALSHSHGLLPYSLIFSPFCRIPKMAPARQWRRNPKISSVALDAKPIILLSLS